MTKKKKLTAEQQISQLSEWIAARPLRYRKTDKRRYAVLKYDGQSVTMTLEEAIDWIMDAGEAYELSDSWMTPVEYEELPEFEGF